MHPVSSWGAVSDIVVPLFNFNYMDDEIFNPIAIKGVSQLKPN